MEKVGLHIVTLLHNITQLGYKVSFNPDFEGMIRIDYFSKYDPEFYEHEHRGFSDGTKNQLEKEIIKSLVTFYENHK